MDGVTVRVLAEEGAELLTVRNGELYIGGQGLARGYLERADLDRHRFYYVDGERYYATGDVAEIDAQGMVTVVGRNDSMVKVRGYSVYLGAIEETLRQSCDVLDAAVTLEAEDEANPWLVAYVVRKPSSTWRIEANSATSRDLRNLLERYLPHYMVPSRYVELEELPINQQTGKLDRKALPSPRRTKPDSPRRLMAAEQASQPEGRAVMRELWGEVLGIDAGALRDDCRIGSQALMPGSGLLVGVGRPQKCLL